MTTDGAGLVAPSDIADIAGVSRGAVSNWRGRQSTGFPEPVGGTAAKPLFSRHEVVDWLTSRGYEVAANAGKTDVWAAMNLLRGQLPVDEAAELVLSLATRNSTDDPSAGLTKVDPKMLALLKEAIDRVDPTSLASAIDFVLERLSKSQGKVGADYGFVGSRTSTLLASLAASRQPGVLYDPACGIGAALVQSIGLGATPSRVVGHDINSRALHMASQRAQLHGVDVELARTNVLLEDVEPSLRADVIILEPPFGIKVQSPGRLTDPRFEFGTPPRSSADTTWLQHAIAHLTEDGRGFALTPAGTLFRGGEESRVRTELIRRGCVEAVVGLPGKMLPHVSTPLALWVLRRPVRTAATERILFVDASETDSPETRVATWLNDPNTREEVPHTEIPVADVLAEDSVLTPQRWVDRIEREPTDVADTYRQGWASITETMTRLQNVLNTFEHLVSFSKPRVMTVGELIDQGVLDLRMGRPKDRYEGAPAELRERIATAADVRDDTLRKLGIDGEYGSYPDLTREGDVLVTAAKTVKARVDEAGGHFPSDGVYRLRVLDHGVLTPGYLAIALCGSWNERSHSESTLRRAALKNLEIPLVPVAEQRDIRLAMVAIQLLHADSRHLAEEASRVGTTLLDAVRYNADLANPDLAVRQTDQDGSVDSEGAK